MTGAWSDGNTPLVKGRKYTFRFDLPATTIVFPQKKIAEALSKLTEAGAMKDVNATAKPGTVFGDAANGDWNLEFTWNGPPGPVISGWGQTLAQLFSDKLPWYDGSLVGAKIHFIGAWEGGKSDAPDKKTNLATKIALYSAAAVAGVLFIYGFAQGLGRSTAST